MIIISTLLEHRRDPESPQLGYLKDKTALWNQVFNISGFIDDGFQRVCTVNSNCSPSKWYYENIDKSLMFSDHDSWVYFIVLDDWVVKVGETGSPLGLAETTRYHSYGTQPLCTTKCRLGRLRFGDGTDAHIRLALDPYIKNGHVASIWAKKCLHGYRTETVCGEERRMISSIHKEMELAYLDYFLSQVNLVPDCNKGRK